MFCGNFFYICVSKIYSMKLSPIAIEKLKGNFIALGALCMKFDRHMKTVEGWIAEMDNRKIISPASVKIISKHTGIPEEAILVSI